MAIFWPVPLIPRCTRVQIVDGGEVIRGQVMVPAHARGEPGTRNDTRACACLGMKIVQAAHAQRDRRKHRRRGGIRVMSFAIYHKPVNRSVKCRFHLLRGATEGNPSAAASRGRELETPDSGATKRFDSGSVLADSVQVRKLFGRNPAVIARRRAVLLRGRSISPQQPAGRRWV